MKLLVVAALITIIVALFSALVFLYRDGGKGSRVVWALTIRVALSVTLFGFLFFSYWMGWIGPAGLR
ncbi:MAG: twin transmembrane helix small protein [Betaproteobacteria bacterium]|nr:twin transmembrane helix small protein [Betaproteobacteria bacterium]